MSFEFYGMNLETTEGLHAYKAVFECVAGSVSAETFYAADYGTWARVNPDQAQRFLRALSTDKSANLRELAARLALSDFLTSLPQDSVEIVAEAMGDEDLGVRSRITEVVRTSVRNGTVDEWLGRVGLQGVARLLSQLPDHDG